MLINLKVLLEIRRTKRSVTEGASMSLYEGISVETAPIPEIVDTVKKVDGGKYSIPWFNFFHS